MVQPFLYLKSSKCSDEIRVSEMRRLGAVTSKRDAGFEEP